MQRTYQSNWLTLNTGGKLLGVNPSRLYDFSTGRFVGRDPLPKLKILVKTSNGSVLGIFERSKFGDPAANSVPANQMADTNAGIAYGRKVTAVASGDIEFNV